MTRSVLPLPPSEYDPRWGNDLVRALQAALDQLEQSSNVFGVNFRPGPTGVPIWTSGTGNPNGAVKGAVGSIYTRLDGGAGSTLYVKESGDATTNTGWVAK